MFVSQFFDGAIGMIDDGQEHAEQDEVDEEDEQHEEDWSEHWETVVQRTNVVVSEYYTE